MMKKVTVLTKTSDESLLPKYHSEEAAGADIRANIKEPLTISPGEMQLVSTGVFFEIPKGYEVQVRPRSGLALKHQISVLNTPGTIDSDYRGEIKIILINHGKQPFVIEPKMRIAQLVLAPVIQAEFSLADELALSSRGENGFGHSGTQ